MLLLVNIPWKYDLDLTFCLSLVSCHSFTRNWAPSDVSLYLFSHFILSWHCVLLPSQSFSLQGPWQRLGCDPITGWLQQSLSADWFYNPHSGSQMGENQLAKKGCTPMYTHARVCANMHMCVHNHTHWLSSLNPYHTSWLYIIAFILCKKREENSMDVSVSVRWDSDDWTTKPDGEHSLSSSPVSEINCSSCAHVCVSACICVSSLSSWTLRHVPKQRASIYLTIRH